MPTNDVVLGWSVDIYVPEVDTQIALGWTHIRVYSAASETGGTSLEETIALVAGQTDYSCNVTSGASTDWAEWCLYSAGLGESSHSERVPVGPPQVTRKQVRQAVGKYLRLLDIHSVTTPASGAVSTFGTLVDPDASVHSYGNRFARVVGGTAIGQTRRVRAGSSGYSNTSTGQITLNYATSPAWVASDEVEFWIPNGDRDPSAAIDDAMNRARHHLWWDDVFYFTTDSGVSEYAAPPTMLEGSIQAVEYVSGTYPDEPRWATVPFSDLRSGKLTVSWDAVGKQAPPADKLVRVLYARFGDRMDSDTDYWQADLDWSVAETAFQYLLTLSAPRGNKEDVADALASLKLLEPAVHFYRRTFLPRPVVNEVPPR